MKKTKKNRQAGFTLIELMVVIVILGILAAYIAPKMVGRTDDAKIIKVKMDIVSFETALKLYKIDNGYYPGTEQQLIALVKAPETGNMPKKWRKGGYLEKKKIPKDPWGNDFLYLSPGIHGDYDITSYGADGIPGGDKDIDKDINSWEIE